MEDPPILLGGARVLEYAFLDRVVKPGGDTSFVVDGVPVELDSVRALVIAEDLVEGGVYLMHCGEDWDMLAAGHHENTAAARESALFDFSGVTPQWNSFRELTEKELAEVEAV